MKKKLSVILFGIFLIFLVAIIKKQEQIEDSFLWCDSYIAAAEESEYNVSLTYFYKNKPIDFETVSSIDFLNATNVSVKSFKFYHMDKIKKYKSIGLELKLHFGKKAISTCDTIKISFANGKSKLYKIGKWTFDIGDKESSEQILDIWNSPVASSDSSEFPYLYIPSIHFSKIKIQYALNKIEYVDTKNKNEINGKINFDSPPPMIIIRPRILCETNEENIIYYGNSCYCGALSISERDIDKSYNILK